MTSRSAVDLSSLGRLVVAFFTRPLTREDFNVARLLRQRTSASGAGIARQHADFEPTQIVERAHVVDAWGRSLETEVSEEPIHTLPAELQDELTGKHRPGRS